MLELIFLSVVQGISEFLPISSSGHLTLFQHLLGIEDAQELDIYLHFPTFFAIVLYFRKPLGATIRGAEEGDRKLVGLVLLATLATLAFYLVFSRYIDASFGNIRAVGLGFLFTTLVLAATRFIRSGVEPAELGVWTALLVGAAQGIAVFPGVSRSGTTIACLLFLGIAPRRAGYISMMMFLPAILGAVALKGESLLHLPYSALQLGLAFVCTFTVSYVSLALLMRLLGSGKFYGFAAWTLLMFAVCMFV